MQAQQNTQAMLPLYERGRQPVKFQSHESGIPVIRVRHEDQIRYELWEGDWLKQAKPLTEYRGLARLLLEEGFPEDTSYRILPAKHQSLRLMWRAARQYVDGNYLKASQLIEKACDAMDFESNQCCWYDHRAQNLLNGLRFALYECGKPGSCIAEWEAAADWFTGGEWPGPGLLGKMMERFGEAMKQIACEAREQAAACRAPAKGSRAHA